MVTWRRILHEGDALQQRSIHKAEVMTCRWWIRLTNCISKILGQLVPQSSPFLSCRKDAYRKNKSFRKEKRISAQSISLGPFQSVKPRRVVEILGGAFWSKCVWSFCWYRMDAMYAKRVYCLCLNQKIVKQVMQTSNVTAVFFFWLLYFPFVFSVSSGFCTWN